MDPIETFPRRRWWWVAALVTVVAAGVAVLVLGLTRESTGRGAPSAAQAAQRFVAALNDGNRDAAAAIACDGFQDQARSEAASGTDPAISFQLDGVSEQGATAQARMSQRFELPGGTAPQVQPLMLSLQRAQGRWLVCGAQ